MHLLMEDGTRSLVLGTNDFGELHAVSLHCLYLVPMETSTDSNFAKPTIFKLLLVTSSNDLDASGSTRTELHPFHQSLDDDYASPTGSNLAFGTSLAWPPVTSCETAKSRPRGYRTLSIALQILLHHCAAASAS